MVWTAEAFLQKRYAAGFKAGYAEGHANIRGKVEVFLEKHPDATVAQLREFLINNRRKGASD